MKKCVTRLLTLVVFTYFLCGCKRAESDSSEQLIVRLTEQARTYICENSDDALNTVIGENGIEISQILYGLLETDGEEEALLICKIPQMSHVGGLDRTIVVCYEMQSGRMHSLLDLPYDELCGKRRKNLTAAHDRNRNIAGICIPECCALFLGE